jgi:hypothetical protein
VKIELRDLIAMLSIIVALGSMLIVSRNARRATNVQTENVDLARIRDQRAELRELKDELVHVKEQVTALNAQLTAANERSLAYAQREIEMMQYAQMPGVTIEDWRRRFEIPPAVTS